MEQILKKIKETKFDESKLLYGKSCSLVGNSSKLLEHKKGFLIDNSDFVIRLNQARIKGYEQFVGEKINLRFLNSHSIKAFNGENCEDNKRTFSKFTENIFDELNEKNFITSYDCDLTKVKEKYPSTNINNISVDFFNFVKKEFEFTTNPTSGFLCLIMILSYFEEISCFGFDFYSSENDHYFEEVKKYDRSCVHSLDIEKRFFNFLEDKNIIKFY